MLIAIRIPPVQCAGGTSPRSQPEKPRQRLNDEQTDWMGDAGQQGQREHGEGADDQSPEGGEEVETELGGRAGVVVEDWKLGGEVISNELQVRRWV